MSKKEKISPIVVAIADAESGSTGEIRVHVSNRWFETDPYGRALRIFNRFGMGRTQGKNAALIYINVRRKSFAILADEGLYRATGPNYWQGLARNLKEDLSSTHLENAVALAVRTIGATLKLHFPVG